MKSHILGFILGIFIVSFAVLNMSENSFIYFNILSILIVLGGSISVSIITSGIKNTITIFTLFFKAFSTSKYTKLIITSELLDVSKKSYYGKINYANLKEQNLHPFIADGLKLIHNKFETDKLRTILINMFNQRQVHHGEIVERVETLSKYPPAFGMMGTIIGLVAVLNQINSPDNMANIGPSMAVALITTLYGIFLSNYILQPIADNLHYRNHEDLKIREVIVEGVLLINKGEDPIYVREVLFSYLTPAERSIFMKEYQESMQTQEAVA